MKSAAVLGAGLQGTLVALSLAAKGYRVHLVDKAGEPFSRASLRNEGKVHLGFVYAKDASFNTARLMIDSALHFAPIVDEIVGSAVPWKSLCSRDFDYVVAPDSMVNADDLALYYRKVESVAGEILARDGAANYLGERPERWAWPVALPRHLGGDRVKAVFRTVEKALDLPAFRELLLTVVRAEPGIELLLQRRVLEIRKTPGGFEVAGQGFGGEAWSIQADIVVNCCWEGRQVLDRQMNFEEDAQNLHRLKYRVIAKLPAELADCPSLTQVQGPYGDLVTYPGTRSAYLSWYPACMRGSSKALVAPGDWEGACNGQPDPAVAEDVARKTLHELGCIIPGVEQAEVLKVDAGIICAHGVTDIDDAESALHRRYDVGVRGKDGYWSINTGKLTCAPLFAGKFIQQI